ncbi:MAG: LptF/LptG family permease [Opitutaceae bacterium]|nr:LptF/LptG family permease [Opitutaceae bacterium]
MFRTFDKHILREWLTILGIVLGATAGILMLQEMYDSFPDLRAQGATTGDLLRYYAVVAPSHLSLVLPVSVLVSVLYTFSQLHRHNEIIAMRAAGVGLIRITRWVWVGAALISVGLFYLNTDLIPWSVEQARVIADNVKFRNQERQAKDIQQIGLVGPVAYSNRPKGRLWMLGSFSAYSHRALSIMVVELDAGRREKRRIVAQEGFWEEETGLWTFLRGREMTFDPITGDVVGQVRQFDRQEFPELTEEPLLMMRMDKRPRDLSLFELAGILGSTENADNPRLLSYAVRYHFLLASPLACLIAAGLAVPFAVSGVRVNPAVGVSKSIGLFVVFWILTMLGNQLGEQGTLPPTIAAWLPNGVMGLAALWFLWKER